MNVSLNAQTTAITSHSQPLMVPKGAIMNVTKGWLAMVPVSGIALSITHGIVLTVLGVNNTVSQGRQLFKYILHTYVHKYIAINFNQT